MKDQDMLFIISVWGTHYLFFFEYATIYMHFSGILAKHLITIVHKLTNETCMEVYGIRTQVNMILSQIS